MSWENMDHSNDSIVYCLVARAIMCISVKKNYRALALALYNYTLMPMMLIYFPCHSL